MAGGAVNQLKEHVEANQAVVEENMHKIEARKWFFTRLKNMGLINWEQFKEEVTRRFTEQGYHNVVADLHDLKQTGGVEEYQSQFEDLKSQVLEKEPGLIESYFVAGFIGGL